MFTANGLNESYTTATAWKLYIYIYIKSIIKKKKRVKNVVDNTSIVWGQQTSDFTYKYIAYEPVNVFHNALLCSWFPCCIKQNYFALISLLSPPNKTRIIPQTICKTSTSTFNRWTSFTQATMILTRKIDNETRRFKFKIINLVL